MTDIKRQWESFMLRLKNEAEVSLRRNKSNGVAIITSHVIMDASGRPLVWVVNKGKRIEPSRDAGEIIKALTEGLIDE